MPIIKRGKNMKKTAKKLIRTKKAVATTKNNFVAKVKKVTNQLSDISLYHNRVLHSLFEKFYLGYVNCNEQEVGLGAIQLKLDTTTSTAKLFPVHVYDLTKMFQSSLGAPSAYMELTMSSSDYPFFTNRGSMVQIGVNDGGSMSLTAESTNRAIQEYFDVRLELFGRNTLRTKYRVQLIKILDVDLEPLVGTASTTANRHNVFWKHMARPFTTNGLIPTDNRVMADMRNQYKILWSKDYEFKDKDSGFDEVQRKAVKIFKRLNQVNIYNESPHWNPLANDNPNTMQTPGASSSTTTECRLKQRIYLVISGTQTVDSNATGYDAAAPATNDICSYNIYYRTKFMTPYLV